MPTALVTGSSSGIGFSTAVALARAGHNVAATMRDLRAAAEIEKVAAAEKLSLRPYELNVDDDASVAAGIAAITTELGPLDVLVNNAGISGGLRAVEETSMETFRSVMETNFFGALRCIKTVVPDMRERRKGTIVNVTSAAGRLASASHSAYSASKWALEALSESLAQELKSFGVRVAIVEPGVIATPIFGKAPPPIEDSPYPHGRRMRALFAAALARPNPPESVANRIVEIVADDGSQLRRLVGADAVALVEGRKQKTDEQVIAEAAQSDEEFLARMKSQIGIDLQL